MYAHRRENRPALVIAHPGHELRLYGWIKQARPRVFVLTDGSGRDREARISSTRALLQDLDAQPGAIFGGYTDAQVYAALLSQDLEFFHCLADDLLQGLLESESTMVVGDAEENEFLTHDVFRAVRFCALRRAEAVLRRRIEHYEVFIDRHPAAIPVHVRDSVRTLDLDDETYALKMEAARRYSGIEEFVEAQLSQFGQSAFRREILLPATAIEASFEFARKREYEKFAEQLVANGHYSEAVRFREHVAPVIASLIYRHPTTV